MLAKNGIGFQGFKNVWYEGQDFSKRSQSSHLWAIQAIAPFNT